MGWMPDLLVGGSRIPKIIRVPGTAAVSPLLCILCTELVHGGLEVKRQHADASSPGVATLRPMMEQVNSSPTME